MRIQEPQHRDHSGRGQESETYPRHNYYAGEDNYDDNLVPGGHHEIPGTSKHRWVAKNVLRDGATLLDPILLDGKDGDWYEDAVPVDVGSAMQLGDAEHFVVADHNRESLGGAGHPKRCNDTYGHLVGGGTIADRDLDAFMNCIDGWLQFLIDQRGLQSREVEALRKKARALKCHDTRQWHDVRIVAELNRAVEHSDGIRSYLEERL
jgi:hypothetical protein